MYSRSYKQPPSGAVKAFEDAYAKEAFLKKTAESGDGSHGCVPKENPKPSLPENGEKPFVEPRKTPSLFGGDNGDMLILLLILLFLADGDRENDAVIPILLGILLFF